MKLQGPDNCGGLNHQGEFFAVDKHGCIDVPDDNADAIEAAFSHGFKVAEKRTRKAAAAVDAPAEGAEE